MEQLSTFINTLNNFKNVHGRPELLINRTGWSLFQEKVKREDSIFSDPVVHLLDPNGNKTGIEFKDKYTFEVLKEHLNGFVYQKDSESFSEHLPFKTSIAHFPIGTKVRLCPSVVIRASDSPTGEKIDVVTVIGHSVNDICHVNVERSEKSSSLLGDKYHSYHYCHFIEIIEMGKGGFDFNFDNSIPEVESEDDSDWLIERRQFPARAKAFHDRFKQFLISELNVTTFSNRVYFPHIESTWHHQLTDSLLHGVAIDRDRFKFGKQEIKKIIADSNHSCSEQLDFHFVVNNYFYSNKEKIGKVSSVSVEDFYRKVGNIEDFEGYGFCDIRYLDLNHFKQWFKKNANKLKRRQRHTDEDQFFQTCSMNDDMDSMYDDFSSVRPKEQFETRRERDFYNIGVAYQYSIDQSHNGYLRVRSRSEDSVDTILQNAKELQRKLTEKYNWSFTWEQERHIELLFKTNRDWLSYMWLNG